MALRLSPDDPIDHISLVISYKDDGTSTKKKVEPPLPRSPPPMDSTYHKELGVVLGDSVHESNQSKYSPWTPCFSSLLKGF